MLDQKNLHVIFWEYQTCTAYQQSDKLTKLISMRKRYYFTVAEYQNKNIDFRSWVQESKKQKIEEKHIYFELIWLLFGIASQISILVFICIYVYNHHHSPNNWASSNATTANNSINNTTKKLAI